MGGKDRLLRLIIAGAVIVLYFLGIFDNNDYLVEGNVITNSEGVGMALEESLKACNGAFNILAGIS